MAPVKPVPVMATLVPAGPLLGVKLVMVGESVTVKLLIEVADPVSVVTEIGPVVALAGTVVRI